VIPTAAIVPMHAPSPRKTLLLLWGTAAVVLIGGFLLARQERQIPLHRDRAPLRDFAAEAQAQLRDSRISIRITCSASDGR
jgi:hypothetical protein